jgi:hypothetical protein
VLTGHIPIAPIPTIQVAKNARAMTMTNNDTPTTRKYPRTLGEAFPKNPEPNFEKDHFEFIDLFMIFFGVGLFLFVLLTVVYYFLGA